MFAKPGFQPVTACSQVLYATNWAMELGIKTNVHQLTSSQNTLHMAASCCADSALFWSDLEARDSTATIP